MAVFRINFTKASLESIKPPKVPVATKGKGGVYDTYYDTKEKGLILIVSNGGGKTYYLYTKVKGRPERIKLGAYTDISVEEARKKAAKHRGEIANGGNPQEAKRNFRQEATFKELFDEYMVRYSKPTKRSWKYDEREINKFLSHWFNRKISSITTHEIQRLHEAIRDKNGLYQANRILERIRAMYNKAIEWGWNGQNPAQRISKFKEKSRDRFLQPYELPYFFAALENESNITAKDYILLSLLTGARKSNVLAMQWKEVNLDRAEWRIPETKNGEAVILPLSQQAVDILKSRKKLSKGPWVFASEASKMGYLQDPKKTWQRLLVRVEIYQLIDLIVREEKWRLDRMKKAKLTAEDNLMQSRSDYRQKAKKLGIEISHLGLPDLRIHDLRRSLGSYQAITGSSLQIIAKSLGHKSLASTKIYSHLNVDPVRDSIERATNTMYNAGKLSA